MDKEPKAEANNNIEPTKIKEEEIIKPENANINNEKGTNEETKKSELLNKPKELINFDVLSHFKENISRPDKNDLNRITKNSYYCINCMHSDCPFHNEEKHITKKRIDYLVYDTHFFDEIDSNINEALKFSEFKIDVKNNINNYIDKMKEELDKLRDIKFNEIDIFFEENEKKLIKLKKEYLEMRKNIEEYYETNKKFFNIEINNNENEDSKNEDVIKNDDNNPNNNVLYIEDIDNSSPNRDIENSVFLLNFELMNLSDTKNLENINFIKNIKNRIDSFYTIVQTELIEDAKIISKFLNLDTKPENREEDNYWDINTRTKKYSEIIQQFRETICDIYHRTGTLEKLRDLIDIFDSKLKKNNKILFDQEFFNNDNNIENNKENNKENISKNEQKNTIDSKKRNCSASNKRSSSKVKSLKKYNTVRDKSINKYKKNGNVNIQTLTLSSDIGLRNIIKKKNENNYNKTLTNVKTETNKNIDNKIANQKMINFFNCVSDDIILDKRVIQRFFAYSITELYNKHFSKIDLNNNDIYYKISIKDNIYFNRNSTNTANNINPSRTSKNDKRGKSAKKEKSSNKVIQNYIKMKLNKYEQNKINNVNKLDLENVDPASQYNIKSVSYLSNYTNRYNSLKEIAKPIIGTNQIQLFFQKGQKITRKTTSLNKEEHGYSLFPEGCRHILIENNLYIIGGTNHVRQPINIVLVYNILFGTLKRLPDMNFSHSYHTVEYLENFDCIISIGGENSNQCEIMNLEDKKWRKLPSLNNSRANTNIYYNNLNSELFVLFGICGIMCDKINYSDSIEVLELNNIKKGWIIVDYYKTPGLNLKVNYCMTIPFTKEQLLIYGGSNMRSFTKNIYALFHMTKNECNKVDTQTMELIKLEEKKSRLVDLALTKLG